MGFLLGVVPEPVRCVRGDRDRPAGSDPSIEQLASKALVTTDATAREKIYRQIQQQLNQRGPFFPLLQPTQVFVATTDLKNAVFNAEYEIDVTQASPK